ncbi:MAG TPA: radical SAM protein [Candidatus Portnoybacteria bacterium]|nr:radical SAM protein [Candidatus Portnoybacteria bacterium]
MLEFIKSQLYLLHFWRSPDFWRLSPKTIWQIAKITRHERVLKFRGKIYSNSYLPACPSEASDRMLRLFKKMEQGIYDPQALIISATNQCPGNCFYCYNKKNKAEENLSLEKIKEVISFFQAKGIFGIFIVGGEPLLRPDLEEIVREGAKHCAVHLDTNGYGLTLERAEKLKEAGLESLQVSLDHYDEKVVDGTVGFSGAFKTAVQAIKIGKEAGLYVCSVMVMTKKMLYSWPEMVKYLDFIKSLGANEVMVYEPKPSGNLYNAGEDILFSDKDREELCRLHIKINKDRRFSGLRFFSLNYFESAKLFGCNAGLTQFYLGTGGEMTPCPLAPLFLGNVKEERLEDIYARFKKVFKQPMKVCTSIFCAKEVSRAYAGQLPILKDEAGKILSKLDFSELPDIYKEIKK